MGGEATVAACPGRGRQPRACARDRPATSGLAPQAAARDDWRTMHDRRRPEPNARLRRAVAAARQLARADGRRAVSSADLRASLGGELPAPPFRGDLNKELDDAAREWWLRAEREAADLGDEQLAPEHLRLVEAGERERLALL